MVEEGFTLALRMGDWKYIKPQTKATPEWMKNKQIESGLSKEPQLYNLKEDTAERHNLAKQYPEKVQEMKGLLDKIKNTGYSRHDYGK